MVNEIETTHRVYRQEWLHLGRYDTYLEATQALYGKYEGRLHPDDLRVTERGVGAHAYARLWNVVAEFKRQSLAESYMEALAAEGGDPTELRTVERNSRAEVALTNYGVLKLPS